MNVFRGLRGPVREALERALKRAVLGPPVRTYGMSELERAGYYSDRAVNALSRIGGATGLGVAAYRDINGEDMTVADYAAHGAMGAAAPIAPVVYGTSLAFLGPGATLRWHRALVRKLAEIEEELREGDGEPIREQARRQRDRARGP